MHQKTDFYVGIIFGREFTITNSLIGSVPKHPIMKKMIDSINAPILSNSTTEIHEITIPWALNKTYISEMFNEDYRNVAFPVNFFFSFPNNKLPIQNIKKILSYRKKESMAMHLWEVSWQRTSGMKKWMSKYLRYIPTKYKNSVKKALGLKK